MEPKLSANAEKVLLFEYVVLKGMPDNFRDMTDHASIQMAVFGQIAGLDEAEVAAAYAEAEDAGMIEKVE